MRDGLIEAMDAHENVNMVRSCIIKTLRKGDFTSSEMAALLLAEASAVAKLERALRIAEEESSPPLPSSGS